MSFAGSPHISIRQGPAPDPEYDSEARGSGTLAAFVAYKGKQEIGRIHLRREAASVRVTWVGVDLMHRRKGIATRLYAAAAKFACTHWRLPLASDDPENMTAASRGFWTKQAERGWASVMPDGRWQRPWVTWLHHGTDPVAARSIAQTGVEPRSSEDDHDEFVAAHPEFAGGGSFWTSHPDFASDEFGAVLLRTLMSCGAVRVYDGPYDEWLVPGTIRPAQLEVRAGLTEADWVPITSRVGRQYIERAVKS